MAEGWQDYALGKLVLRRQAMMRIVERSLPVSRYSTAVDPATRTLRSARRFPVSGAHKIWLWHFVWDLPEAVRVKDHAEDVTAIDAFCLVGPAFVDRVGQMLTGRSALGGSDLSVHCGNTEAEREEFWQGLKAAMADCPTSAHTARVGQDIGWPGDDLRSDLISNLRFEPKAEVAQSDWTPAALREIPRYAVTKPFDYRQLIDAVIAGCATDTAHVRDAAQSEYARRLSTEPWRDLSDAQGFGADGQAFLARAGVDLVGFEPPQDTQPVRLRARILPFYANTDLVDIVDRRGGYPRMSRFLAEFSTAPDQPRTYTRITPVDWNAATIHEKNKAEQLDLSRQDVCSYLEFFCQHIRAEYGYFRVSETADMLNWRGGRQAGLDKMRPHFGPIEIWTDTPIQARINARPHFRLNERIWVASAPAIYACCLYHAIFVVDTGGFVEMLHDQVRIRRLPIVPERITEHTHFVYLAHGVA